MPDRPYTAADIEVLDYDEAFRRRPGMYFGIGPDNPGLATRVLREVLSHELHPGTALAPSHTLGSRAVVLSDLVFSVTVDQAGPLAGPGGRLFSHHAALLGPRWLAAGAAALSSRAVIERRADGQGLRQEVTSLRHATAPEAFEAPAGQGMRMTFELDPEYFGPGAAIAPELDTLDLHGPHCTATAGPGVVEVRDCRREPPAMVRYHWPVGTVRRRHRSGLRNSQSCVGSSFTSDRCPTSRVSTARANAGDFGLSVSLVVVWRGWGRSSRLRVSGCRIGLRSGC